MREPVDRMVRLSYAAPRREGASHAPIAQLVEHLTLNQQVLGSTPSGGTCSFRQPLGDVTESRVEIYDA